jgi:hypothetical protein
MLREIADWIYHRIHYSLGSAIAEVSVAIMSILILVLVGVGIRAGLQMDHFIRKGNVEACTIYQSFRPLGTLFHGWDTKKRNWKMAVVIG